MSPIYTPKVRVLADLRARRGVDIVNDSEMLGCQDEAKLIKRDSWITLSSSVTKAGKTRRN
jgi:hypothetical protein